MPDTYPAKHDAVVTVGKRMPLAIMEYETPTPGPGEVVVRVQWTASSPLNLHQADGGLLVTPPFILGDTLAGVIVSEGPEDPSAERPDSTPLVVGDHVMGFTPPSTKSAGFQTYVVAPRNRLGRVPSHVPMAEAITVPSSLVTAIHAITKDLQLDLPWPRTPETALSQVKEPILVWGGAGSVGQFAIQSTPRDASSLWRRQMFQENYRDQNVVDQIKDYAPSIRFILDCIGHAQGTLAPLSGIAREGTKVAVMLPIIITDATEDIEPEYDMDPAYMSAVKWASGVEVLGVRTFFYEENPFMKRHLQPDIVPTLLESGAVKPNKIRVVEGETLLDRAQQALDLLRQRAPSGERLVWRVSQD